MKSSPINKSKKIIMAIILTISMLVAKEYSDNQGYTYSTDITNSIGDVEFIQIRGESAPLMSDANSNQSVAVLPSKTFMQLVDRDNDWFFVRIPDSNEGYIEGWIRDNKIKKEKNGDPSIFYGKALMLMEDIIRKRPAWVVTDSTALLSLPKTNAKNVGNVFFSTKIFIQNEITDYYQVKIYDDYDQNYIDGWVTKKDLTEDEKAISGTKEPVTNQQTTPDESANNSKIQEIKAKLETIEKLRKEKEDAEFIANATSKEVQFKAIKIKKYQEDIGLINNSVDEYRKEISNDQQDITAFNQEIKNLETLITEKNQQSTNLTSQKTAWIKQQESEQQLAKAKDIEAKQQQETLAGFQTELKKLTVDLAKTEQEATTSLKEIETAKAQIDKFSANATELQSKLETEQNKLNILQQKSAETKIAQQREIESRLAAKEEQAKQLIVLQEKKVELQKDFTANNQQIEYFNKEKALILKESNDLGALLSKSKNELIQAGKELAQIHEKNKARSLEIAKLSENNNQQITRLQAALKTKNSQIEQARIEQDQINSDLDKLKSDAERKKTALSEFNGKINELKNLKLAKIAETENQNKEREKLRKEQIEQFKNDLTQLKNNQSALNTEISGLKTKNSQLAAENIQNETRKSSLKSELAKITSALTETLKKKEVADKAAALKKAAEQEKVRLFQTKLNEQNKKLADLKTTLEKKVSEIETARLGVKEDKNSKDLLEKSVADKKREINNHNIVINSLKQQISASQKSQIETQNKLKAELVIIRETIKSMDTERANSKLQLLSEQKAAKQLELKLAGLNSELQAKEAKIIELKNKKIKTIASKETKESDRKLSLLIGQLKELKNRLSNVENQIFSAKDESRELLLKIKNWENDLLDKSYDQDLLVSVVSKAKSRKVTANEQDALKAHLAELEQGKANLTKTGGEPNSNKSRKTGGFKHNNDESKDNSASSNTSNWNREANSISMLIGDKKVIITDLYNKYKTKDNLLKGHFTLKFDLGSDGKTKKVRITDAIWSNQSVGNELNKEIEKKVREWNFPPDNHSNISQRKDKPIEIPYIF